MSDSSHVKAYRSKYLPKEDDIQASADGYIGKMMGEGKDKQHNGALIVTRKLVVFYRKGFFGEVNQSIPLDKVTSIEQSSMLGFKSIRIHTSHDDLAFTTTQGDKYPTLVAAIDAGRASKPSPSLGGPSESPLDALRKLGELRSAGVVSDAEFEEKKRHLLGKL